MASTSNRSSATNPKAHHRIEIWRQEVSDATASPQPQQQDETSDRSDIPRSRFWSKLLKPKSGKTQPEENSRTEMYESEDRATERKNVANDDHDESLQLKSESTEPDALRKRKERLERAARLIMASNGGNEGLSA